MFYLAFFATAVTMVCQTIGQKYTSECNASLILSLESVFGVAFSVIFYGEILTLKVILGFILIFIAIIISETKLSFLKKGGMLDEEDR
ncbi:MAG: EamA family transporter [Coprobacillus cateniformis]